MDIKNSLKIINIGRMTVQKDQILLLRAINLIKDIMNIYLIVIGKGSEYRSLNLFIKEHNLKNNVNL